jgi:outer membrane protein OmpA-like peptidoglycan-associated protein
VFLMTLAKTLLAAGTSFSLLAVPALAANDAATQPLPPPPAVTQADNPVATAQSAVEKARADLRAAMASGQGVDEARQKLRDALQALADAQAAAGISPTPPPPAPAGQATPPAAGATPPAPPPPAPPAPAVEQATPPVVNNLATPLAPALTPPAPAVVTPPATDKLVPPAPTDQGKPRNKGKPPENPVTGPTPPPPANTTTTTTPPVTVAPQNVAPPSAEQAQPIGQTTTPPAPPPVIALPPPVVVTPPPPPPPDATQGNFDLKKFHTRPKFGEAPPPQAAGPAPVLPKSEDAVKEGAVLTAPDGRVIVKEGGQVTVTHDDSARFLEQGGRIQTAPSANGNITTTVARPDGSQIVTIRDASGDIIQRYRKKPDGSIEVLIGGSSQQPGILDRMLGRGNQPPPPPPPTARLKLGPLQITIPQQQYIVESSRASPQLLEQTLAAPPVQRLDRSYTLDEIRRNGRLRDMVRRIDVDTITFDTGGATVPDDQIQAMQAIGGAIRQLVTRDPTQVILVEGHTDAVGSDLSNLALSDRRAETVAEILSYYFGVPPENLVTQGYGEQFLKIPTVAAERQNRRVAFRNITDLLRGGQ